MIGESLHHVANIHHDRIRNRGDGYPASIPCQDLQACFVRTDQQGDEIDVLMPGSPHSLRFLVPDWRIVNGPQYAVTQQDFVSKPLFIQPKR